jgi:gamma-glutamyltranspeptidase/glutathione hydrolase
MQKLLLLSFLCVALCACSPNKETTTVSQGSTEETAVAMPDTFAASVAMAVLNDGGNAIDAAIAAQFTLAVTYPEAGNIGGGGFMTIYFDQQANFLDYREMAPNAAHRDMYLDNNGDVKTMESLYGAKASGTPGTVAGMWAAHQRYGKLPWSRLLQPAISLAQEGFIVPEKLASRVSSYIEKINTRGLNSNFSDYFSQAATPGALFKQPELAATLTRIRDNGKDGFYTGETADLIVGFMQANNGLISHEDLTSYQAKWREPIQVDWRGYKVITSPPPSSGGIAIAQWLGMMDVVLTSNPLPPHNSAPYVHMVSEMAKRVFADRAEYLGDPDFIDVPVAPLIAPDYIKKRAAEVNLDAISATDKVKPGLYESEDTTHFSIVDAWGNAVANTTTINLSFGSGVVAAGAGFLLNDEMDDFSAKPGVPNYFGAVGGEANAIAPQKRMLSSMTPTIVLKGKEVKLVTGSPGGTTILSSVVESIFNTLLFDMSAEDAANSPRFHHQLLPKDTIRHHDGFAPETLQQLVDMGYTLDDSRFGDIHLILRTDEGLTAASEQNGRGQALVSSSVNL